MENDPDAILVAASLDFRNTVLPLFGINGQNAGLITTPTESGVVIEHSFNTKDKHEYKVTYTITGTYDNAGSLISLKYKKSTQLPARTIDFEIEANSTSLRINFPACDENSDLTFSFDPNCPKIVYKFCEGKAISYDSASGFKATKTNESGEEERINGIKCHCFNGIFYSTLVKIIHDRDYWYKCMRERIFQPGKKRITNMPVEHVIGRLLEKEEVVPFLKNKISDNLLNCEESFEKAFLPLLPRDPYEAFEALNPHTKEPQNVLAELQGSTNQQN